MLYIRAVAAEVMRYNFYRKMCNKCIDNIKDIYNKKSIGNCDDSRYYFYRYFPNYSIDNIKDIYHRKKLEAAMIRGIIFL